MKLPLLLFAGAALWLVSFGSLLTADDAEPNAIKKERGKFAGKWQVVSAVLDGAELKGKYVEQVAVINESDGRWAIVFDDDTIIRGTSEIDPTKYPKTVDLTITEGENVGQTILGIYEFNADTRKICIADAGKERPKQFLAPAGSGRSLVLLKRLKK
ncbi:MAG TPA: TIGR03067 domain-containing protein [Pirellulales bacterium]|nr:TIGR03067 domain-containing protein [Pirellulales bacterium]